MKPVPFSAPAELRNWFEAHHATEPELVVLFYRKESGRGGVTYAEALDEALCFGWIDGIRRRHDATSYTIRFTPRRPNSIWSQVNIRHVERLTAARKMRPAGAKAFADRTASRMNRYSFENRPTELPASLAATFRANRSGWDFFQAQPPGYRKTIIWWIVSAKQEATRERRLTQVIADSAAGRRVDLTSPFAKRF